MFATQVLPEDLSENTEKEDDNVEIVGFILVNGCRYEIRKGETKIGRDPTVCSIVIENFTVSKVHAVIESEGIDDTFIYDAESTNQTKLGKKTLKPHCRYKLENDSSITFGNITARFMLPLNIRENAESKSNLENFKASNGLEDIFDVVTQVTVPQAHTSGKILQFEKELDSFQIFKVPDLADSGEKVKKSFGSSKDSVEITELQLNSQDLVSRTEYYNSSYETSGIFSLSTQCQIIQSCSSKESKSKDKILSDNHRNNELDSVKALLYDDQDGVLCTFMSLHSPGGQAPSELPQIVKTEVAQEDYSQLFDVQAQAQTTLAQASGQKNVEQASQFTQDLCSQNSPKPNTCSSQFDNGTRAKLNLGSVVSGKFNILTKDAEEDFIKTQEFKSNPPLEECTTALLSKPVGDDAPQESDSECYFEKTLDLSAAEGLSENEDLICTQKYEVLHKGIQETTNNVPENEKLNESNEDFMETQLYDFEKEENSKRSEEETAGKPGGVAFVVSESPEKDSEPVEVNTDFTQRNLEEDFISTQAFSEIIQDRNDRDSESSGRSDDDYNDEEDFIATQPVDLLPSNTAKSKSFQEPISVGAASRESSPDLLDSGFSVKTSTDFMSEISRTSSSELLEKTDSLFLSNVKKELNEDINIFPVKSVVRIESSGEETESDLEIIFDKSDTSKIMMVGESGDKSRTAESHQPENNTTVKSSGVSENNDSNSSYVFQLEPEAHEDFASNPTPTRQNIVPDQGRTAESDSDATDCEDVVVVFDPEVPIEQELSRKITSDETKSTSTPPSEVPPADDGCKDDKESPSFEIGNDNEHWSQLSLEMPGTQDMERTLSKFLQSKDDAVAQDPNPKKEADYQTPSKILKIEVKADTFGSGSIRSKLGKQIDSPLKRPGKSTSEVEAVPLKKFKTEGSDRKLRSSEKQFLKLWQVHDIEQIQPYRTRSSLKNGVSENKSNNADVSLGNNISNNFATSRRETRAKRKTRKLSFDITPYLCKKVENSKRTFLEGRKKETSPEKISAKPKPVECCDRVLRSSSRNNGIILPPRASEYPTRQALNRSRRNSRRKTEDCFSNPCVNVIFTGFDCESLEKIIFHLGGKKTNDLSLGDVVVADKVRRTVKFLSAIALSLPITSPQWLLACKAEKKFLNPWDFILKDEESERKWGFELKASLERSKNMKLMQGLSVFATASAKPPVKDLMAIVKYCGGTPLFEPPHTWPKKTVIVSCPEDKRFWPLAKSKNIKVVHYEFILIGILRQQLDFKTYKLR